MSKVFKATAYPLSSQLVGEILSADLQVTLEGELFLQSVRQHATVKIRERVQSMFAGQFTTVTTCRLVAAGRGTLNKKCNFFCCSSFFFFPPIILGDYLSFNLLFPQINGKCFWLFSNGPWPRTLHLLLVKKNQTVEMWSGIRPYWASAPLRTSDSLIKRQYNCQSPLKANLKSCEWIWQHVEGDKKWNKAEALDFLHLFNVLQLCKANQEQNPTNWTLERLPSSVLVSLPQLFACKHLR